MPISAEAPIRPSQLVESFRSAVMPGIRMPTAPRMKPSMNMPPEIMKVSRAMKRRCRALSAGTGSASAGEAWAGTVGNTPEGEGLEITSNAPQVFHRDHRRITGGGQRKQRVFPAIGYGDIGLVRPPAGPARTRGREGTDRG
jgi:hypothetical protein